MQRYLKQFIFATISIGLVMASFIWVIDPYAIYKKLDINSALPIRIMSERVFKTVALTNIKADVIFLGTSRINVGMTRNNPIFKGKEVLNLATAGQTIHETKELIAHVVNRNPPKEIVIGLDFFSFNASEKNTTDFVDENFEELRKYKLLFSISSLSDAVKFLKKKGYLIYSDGFYPEAPKNTPNENWDKKFIRSQRAFMLDRYNLDENCQFEYISKRGWDAFDDLASIILLAHQHNIKLRIFFSPPHARLWETMADLGLYKTWEDWKRRIVSLNNEIANKQNQEPFVIWDFSGFDKISTESVPISEDKQAVMERYVDVSHYMPAVGWLILDRIYGKSSEEFGVPVSVKNIEPHLLKIRRDRDLYRQTHSYDVNETQAMVSETMSQFGWCYFQKNNH